MKIARHLHNDVGQVVSGLLRFVQRLLRADRVVATLSDVLFVGLTALMLVDVAAVEQQCCGRDFVRLHAVAQVDIESGLYFRGRCLQIVKAHLLDSRFSVRPHRDTLRELPCVGSHQRIECGHGISDASLIGPAPINPSADACNRFVLKFSKIVSCAARAAVTKPPEDIVELAGRRRT